MTKVCRLCLAKLQRGSKYFNINAVESFTGFMPYRDQLTTCIPEMALDLIPNPVICNNCRTALKSSYDFKSRCLMVEKKIRNYVAGQPSNTAVYNLTEIDVSNLPKPTKFEAESTKETTKLVSILPKGETTDVSSQPSSILSNLLTVKEEHILCNSPEIQITNITTTPKGRVTHRAPRGSCSTEVTYTPIEKDEHGLYTCNHCDKKFPNIPSLHTHKTRVHEEDYLCNFCNVPFKSLQNLRKHNQQCQKIRTGPPATSNSVLTKRPHLPTKAKNHLKRWLFNHTDHPYPTDVEKQQLMKETNLSLLQVENWFINARRRILADLTKLRNMKGVGRLPRGRGGRGRGRVRAELEDIFDEDLEKMLSEEDEAATRVLRQLNKRNAAASVEDSDIDEEEGDAIEASMRADDFLEDDNDDEDDDESAQREIITVNPLENVLESSMDSHSNESGDQKADPLDDSALDSSGTSVKMEIEIEER